MDPSEFPTNIASVALKRGAPKFDRIEGTIIRSQNPLCQKKLNEDETTSSLQTIMGQR